MFSNLIRTFSFLPQEVVIVAAKRTPIGSFMGRLSSVPSTKLAAHAIKAALSQASLDPLQVNEVVFGNILGSGSGQSPTRQAAILAGLKNETVCTGINKLCASGLKSITLAAQSISLGHSNIIIAGGMENMSQSPYILSNFRTGQMINNAIASDSITYDGLMCPFNKLLMGGCTEKTILKYSITRDEQDKFCITSYQRAIDAWKKGFFDKEISTIDVSGKKGVDIVNSDEELSKVKFDKITSLKPVFDPNGSITAANASKLNDGACAVILMSATTAKSLGLKPLAKILSFADSETEPVHFAIAPKAAMESAITRAKITKNNVDLFEINEAFSAVTIMNMKLLDLDHQKVNINGGAVSLGHPVGMSGARLVSTLIYALKERNQSIGVAGICNGGGGATSIVIEAL